jgi:hypothetical protein
MPLVRPVSVVIYRKIEVGLKTSLLNYLMSSHNSLKLLLKFIHSWQTFCNKFSLFSTTGENIWVDFPNEKKGVEISW